ncbi:MAG: hypothetical protein LUM44_02445 [Pyrinomonadaceae bacterium]|nr:hypothetical protein [Pyrinomonadaceae bacterium]
MKRKESKSETKKNSKTGTVKEKVTVTQLVEKIQEAADYIVGLFENAPDERILHPQNNEFIDASIDSLQQIRNRLHDSADSDKELIANAFAAIIDRTRERIDKIRKEAAERSPELARKLKPPEYEMPVWYNESLQTFMELVERRDEFIARMKLVLPEKRAEYQKMIAEMDSVINEGEEAFAVEYERFQKRKQYEDGFRKLLKTGSKKELAELRNHLKKNPTRDGVVERLLREEFPE